MGNRFFNMDERGIQIARRISTILYIITLYSLVGFQLYRQFVLQQPSDEWNDIAILISVNVIVWLGSLFYLSGVVGPNLTRMRYLVIGFTGFVAIGLGFTIFKYAVLLHQTVHVQEVLAYFFTVLKISVLLGAFWGLLAYLGNKRIERQIK